ncbi:GlsB/YeaQ/YmgE family stress response membrane protein [Vagococcus intermedius]|uniref:GlsB/YeaQ/YmgE family stress response membrane protein n=1 Tax=Vagococcus intermedius TaxID=2991418 RepID=A0AAF0IAA4_9ENTE|nr:GlsB/YeaQ/YmgE family stress response membrane protein [Vagococcus intermedius]WEG74297.1 GlsB/YeaQ/YmgE family stress response membrane protein [Vagococcus intermedius]WEG75792.1 GlsB/YeaQ/YmgE family stress response membrane protein [Vagococcus intermedius]
MHLLAMMIVGLLIGAAASAITSKSIPVSGWLGNILAGLIGSWLGQSLFGTWGPRLAGISLLPSLVGAIILVLVVSLVMSNMAKRN